MNQRLLLLAALVNVLRTGYALIGIGFLEKI
jgi:arginyl-tRNA synthetase